MQIFLFLLHVCNLNRCPTNSTSHSLSVLRPWELDWRFGMSFLLQKRKHGGWSNAWMLRAHGLRNHEDIYSWWKRASISEKRKVSDGVLQSCIDFVNIFLGAIENYRHSVLLLRLKSKPCRKCGLQEQEIRFLVEERKIEINFFLKTFNWNLNTLYHLSHVVMVGIHSSGKSQVENCWYGYLLSCTSSCIHYSHVHDLPLSVSKHLYIWLCHSCSLGLSSWCNKFPSVSSSDQLGDYVLIFNTIKRER